MQVAADGKVTVLSGTSPHGQGHATSWAQIAADTLQVPLEDIEVIHGDTKIVPKGIGTFGSRSAPVGGAAVHESSETVREGATAIAAHLLEAAPADMRLDNGAFHVVGSPGMIADMVVLSGDLLTIEPEKILDVQVEMTVVDGKVLFERS